MHVEACDDKQTATQQYEQYRSYRLEPARVAEGRSMQPAICLENAQWRRMLFWSGP